MLTAHFVIKTRFWKWVSIVWKITSIFFPFSYRLLKIGISPTKIPKNNILTKNNTVFLRMEHATFFLDIKFFDDHLVLRTWMLCRILLPYFVKFFNFLGIGDHHVCNQFIHAWCILQPRLVVPDNIGMVKLGQNCHLLQKFKRLRVIVINDHLLNGVDIWVNSMLTTVHTAKTSFSYHHKLLIISFIPASRVRVLMYIVLQWLLDRNYVFPFLVVSI